MKYFGEVSAQVIVVEFQKRGLPHAHILVTLKNGYKLSTVNDIDKYISAEIPDSETDPIWYNTVVNNMIHGLCDSRCIIEGQCSKHTLSNVIFLKKSFTHNVSKELYPKKVLKQV